MARSWWQSVFVAVTAISSLASAQSLSGLNATNTTLPSLLSEGTLFITPAQDLAFALNIPSTNTTQDIYFSMAMPVHTMWSAIGLGTPSMANSLMLIMYSSSTGRGVTISPRYAGSKGHTEPAYTSDIKIDTLSGTGIADNGTMYIFNGRCRNCRSWSVDGNDKTISLDMTSKRQNMIYATGEHGDIGSDDPNYPLRMHANYGTFTMDMVRATGGQGKPPVINVNAIKPQNVGASQGIVDIQNHKDLKGVMHAIIMVFTFVGLFPFGSLVLRLGGWVRWHALNQVVGMVLVIIGASLGFAISGLYNRSRNYNSAHQIIGLFIFCFIFIQFTLGFLHHKQHKQNPEQKTKFAPIHVWLGRLTIVLGIINGFLGFILAQASFYNYILAGLVLFIIPLFLFILLVKMLWNRRKAKKNVAAGLPPKSDGGGYQMEPWRYAANSESTQGFAPPPTYHAHAGRG